MGHSKHDPAIVAVRGSEIHGRGVFVERPILEGEVILAIDDSEPVLDRAKLTTEEEVFIDVFVGVDGAERVTRMKPPECLINRSCHPNPFVLTDMSTGVRRVVARQDLQKDDELTWDYASNIWEEWVAPVPCQGGAENCRGMIEDNFFTLRREVQRGYLPILDTPFKQRFAARLRSLGVTTDRLPP